MSLKEDVVGPAGDCDVPLVIPVSHSGILRTRINEIKTIFIEKYNANPDFFIRVPGRVNLIGEHIDYCGYAVCPMALKQNFLLASKRTNDATLKLTNSDPRYPDFEIKLEDISISRGDNGSPAWYNYFLCGLKGVLEISPIVPVTQGLLVALTGDIPPSSGLSSSSALVCAAALCTSYANKLHLSRRELAALSSSAERYIGTQGGGMDQAIAFLGTKGSAKLIEFNPLHDCDVKLPSEAVFVISHSLTVMNKAATAHFNCRVVECRLASQILAKKSKVPWEKLTRLADLQKTLGFSLQEMIQLVRDNLHEEPYTKQEICMELETTEENLNELSLSENTRDLKQFKLHQRALHVFQEAWRVREFCRSCEKGDGLQKLGRLMSESHVSLRDLYECSHPELDQLVSTGTEFMDGARLTGAGWGGCAVAITSADRVDNYIATLKQQFYAPRHEIIKGKNIEHLVFPTEPQNGAAVLIDP